MTAENVVDPATCAALHEFHAHHVDLALNVSMEARCISGVATLCVNRLSGGSAATTLKLDVFHLNIHSVRVALPGGGALLLPPAPPAVSIDGGVSDADASEAETSVKEVVEGEEQPYDGRIEPKWTVKPFTSFGEVLEVELPLEVAQESAFELTIRYETDPESPGVCWLTKEQTAGKQLPFVYTQGQEVLNRSFFPCQDSPSVRVTYAATVDVPNTLTCVMSAKLRGVVEDEAANTRRFTFEMRQSIPVYLVAMAVGDLAEAPVGPRSSIWTEPCMLEAATQEFDGVLEHYLSIGEKLFGEYQWEQYDVLVMPPSFPYGGMENPRLTFVSPCTIAGDKSLVSIVAHELSHSWFGNLVTNATWSDFFLNEGFTMYAERRITAEAHGKALTCLDAKLGEALLREEISSLGEQSPLTRLRVPLEDGIDPGDCYNQCAYEKGYAFVCHLRSLVGSDAAFDDFLKRYCAKFRFQSIPAESMMSFFLECFPALANGSGTDLNVEPTFQTWLHEPGYPRFTPDLSEAQEVMQHCESLAFHWRSSSVPVQASVLYLSEEAKSWEALPVLYFLDCCMEAKFSSPDVVITLGDTLAFSASKNSEILFRWAQVLVKNEVVSRLAVVRRFLEMQGKQKFQLPLYRLLTASPNPEVRAFATESYAATKSMLHVMVRDRIELLLKAMSSNKPVTNAS